jgi:hypothetical protein
VGAAEARKKDQQGRGRDTHLMATSRKGLFNAAP